MPITLQTAQVKPENYKGHLGAQDLAALFQPKADAGHDRDLHFAQLMGKTDPNLAEKKHQLICLRTVDDCDPKDIAPCGNGLVHTLEAAYSGHYHLILRPEDIWFAILSQFSLYVNANAEKLRSVFVSHEGKKKLEVEAAGTITSADFGGMAEMMGSLIQKNIVDPDLREWIIPNFSTTKPEDKVIASIFMMGTLQKYFDYGFTLQCGIPSVTLLGERADWVALRARVDKLTTYGEEPSLWHALLAPVCDSLVRCFDTDADPTAVQDSIDFWSHVCHRQRHGSGSSRLCGWATVFCVWNGDGEWQGSGYAGRQPCSLEKSGHPSWPQISADAIPRAGAEVEVLVDDNGTEYNTVMVAGLSATKVHQGIESSVSPLAGWAMYIKP